MNSPNFQKTFPALVLFLSANLILAETWKGTLTTSIAGAIVPGLNTTKFGVGITVSPTYQTELRGPPVTNPFQVLKLSTVVANTNVTLSAAATGTKYFVINSNGGANGIIFSTGSPDASAGVGTERMRITPANIATYVPLIAGGGTVALGRSNLAIGAMPTLPEGGELELNRPFGGGRTAYLDNYQTSPVNSFLRFLSGPTDAGSDTWLASIDLTNGDFGTYGKLSGSSISTTGQLTAGSIKVNNWTITAPDYVFDPHYRVRSLLETERFVKKNRHLPEIPSAAQMKQSGIDLAEMNLLLLKKVEELTLHAIEQEKRMNKLEALVLRAR